VQEQSLIVVSLKIVSEVARILQTLLVRWLKKLGIAVFYPQVQGLGQDGACSEDQLLQQLLNGSFECLLGFYPLVRELLGDEHAENNQ